MDITSTLQRGLVRKISNDFNTAAVFGQITLEDFLSSPRLQPITEILENLQNKEKSHKWLEYSEDDLFAHILMDKSKLMTFTNLDLNIILRHPERILTFETVFKKFLTVFYNGVCKEFL